MNFEFSLSTNIVFGQDSVNKLPEILKKLNAEHIMLIVDGGVKAAGIAEIVESRIKEAVSDVFVFDQVIPNPTDELVESTAQMAKDKDIDAIVAVGGGSSIDLAKAVNILLTNPAPINQYAGFDTVPNPGKPLITMPTTAGTSSEISNVIALIDTKKVVKYIIFGKNVGPYCAIIDPDFTKTMPASVTAGTGMDAMTHAIESYTSTVANPFTEFQSLKSLELLNANIKTAVEEPSNMDARTNMMLGCVVVGCVMSNTNLGLVHGIAHTLSAHFNLPHGMANAAVLPYVVKYNARAIPEKMTEMAKAMGLSTTGDCERDTKLVVEHLIELEREIGVKTLQEQNVPEDALEMLADDVLKEPVLMFNARGNITKEDVIGILKEAY